MRLQRLFGLFGGLVILLTAPMSFAAFHLWDIVEVYSNEDGSVQYIELFTTSNSQQFLSGHTLTASSDGMVLTFDFTNSSSPTANRSLLIATPGFAGLPGAVTPDFTLPAAPFFDPNATTIILNFAEGTDIVTFSSTDLPTDGIMSINRNLVMDVNSPTNFAGESGMLPETPIFANGFETQVVR